MCEPFMVHGGALRQCSGCVLHRKRGGKRRHTFRGAGRHRHHYLMKKPIGYTYCVPTQNHSERSAALCMDTVLLIIHMYAIVSYTRRFERCPLRADAAASQRSSWQREVWLRRWPLGEIHGVRGCVLPIHWTRAPSTLVDFSECHSLMWWLLWLPLQG